MIRHLPPRTQAHAAGVHERLAGPVMSLGQQRAGDTEALLTDLFGEREPRLGERVFAVAHVSERETVEGLGEIEIGDAAVGLANIGAAPQGIFGLLIALLRSVLSVCLAKSMRC